MGAPLRLRLDAGCPISAGGKCLRAIAATTRSEIDAGNVSGHCETALGVMPMADAAAAVVPPSRRMASVLSMAHLSVLSATRASPLSAPPAPIAAMSTLKARATEAIARGFTNARMAKAAGVSSGAVSQWISGNTKTLAAKSAIGLAALTGKSAAWWIDGKSADSGEWLDPKAPAPAGGAFSLAHVVSDLRQTMNPTTIAWESLVPDRLPDRFSLVVRDEAMAPQFKPGHTVEFNSTRQAKPGDVVLLVDADHNAYIRDYVERRPGLWTAAPRSRAYQPLESVADGLRVLAVLVGHTWG